MQKPGGGVSAERRGLCARLTLCAGNQRARVKGSMQGSVATIFKIIRNDWEERQQRHFLKKGAQLHLILP
jgi:hypothetical protein